MREIINSYQILGLIPGASPEEIKLVYRNLVKTWHPDLFPPGSSAQLHADEKLKEINLAWERIEASLATGPAASLRSELSKAAPADQGPLQARGNAGHPKEAKTGTGEKMRGAGTPRANPSVEGRRVEPKRQPEPALSWWHGGIWSKAVLGAALGASFLISGVMISLHLNRTGNSPRESGQSFSRFNPESEGRLDAEALMAEKTGPEGNGPGKLFPRQADETVLANLAWNHLEGTRFQADKLPPDGRNGPNRSGQRVPSTASGEMPPSSVVSAMARREQENRRGKELEGELVMAAFEAEQIYRMGMTHEAGIDIPRDLKEAVRLFRQAADLGHAQAQKKLGHMYAEGKGVPRDLGQAREWFRRASEQGNTDAAIASGILSLGTQNH